MMSHNKDSRGKALKVEILTLFAVSISDYSDPKTLLECTVSARNGKTIDLNADTILLVIDELQANNKHYYVCLIGENEVAILSSKLGTVI
jgi:hypothetical protein